MKTFWFINEKYGLKEVSPMEAKTVNKKPVKNCLVFFRDKQSAEEFVDNNRNYRRIFEVREIEFK